MRILFSALPSHGHTYPLIPLATAAREAGHHVVFATGESLHPSIVAAGLEPVAAGTSIPEAATEVVRDKGLGNPFELEEEQRLQLMSTVFGSVLPRRFVNDLHDVLRSSRFDLVVHESGNSGAGLAAMLAEVPGLAHGFGRASFDLLGPSFTDSLGDLAAELGLRLPDSVTPLGNPYLDIYPASMQDPTFVADDKRFPLRPVPFSEPGELPGLVTSADRTRPLVYLTFGTAFASTESLRLALDGLAQLDVDVLVATGPRVEVTELRDVPDNVTPVPWVPQADLLAHLDLVVHHGGSGTTLGALGAGIPQLVVPQGADQFINAEAVATAGVGVRLLADEVTSENLGAQAKKLLADEDTAAAVRRVAAEIAAMPSPKETVERLPEFAR